MVQNESKLSFRGTYFLFQSALAILEPQIHVVVQQFQTEIASLLSKRIVLKSTYKVISHGYGIHLLNFLYFITQFLKNYWSEF